MCKKAVEAVQSWLERVSDNFKTKGMCNKAVQKIPHLLEYVPDWFVTQGQIKLWHDDACYCNADRLDKWYDGYQKRKTQKTKIKDKLMPVAWHPSRRWDWCVPEDEKRETVKLFLTI